MRTFEHPGNGHQETVGGASILLTLLLGPFYLASRDLWGHAIVWTVIVCSAGISGGLPGVIICSAVLAIGYAIAAQPLIATALLRAGWREVDYETLSSSSGFAQPLHNNPLRIDESDR